MVKLKINTLRGGRWHDKDKILLHAAFQLLVDFVEQEQPAKLIDWSADVRHQKSLERNHIAVSLVEERATHAQKPAGSKERKMAGL